MMDQLNMTQMEVPSLRKIVAATVAALIVAGVILVTVVLPAEYGIDPLGTEKPWAWAIWQGPRDPAPATAAKEAAAAAGRGGVDARPSSSPRSTARRQGSRERSSRSRADTGSTRGR